MIIYKNLAETEADLLKFTEKDQDTITGIVTGELLKDSNKHGVAPFRDGTLKNSSILSSILEEGLIIYSVAYARVLYFLGSISGILMWVEVTALKNKKKYKKMIIKLKAANIKDIFN